MIILDKTFHGGRQCGGLSRVPKAICDDCKKEIKKDGYVLGSRLPIKCKCDKCFSVEKDLPESISLDDFCLRLSESLSISDENLLREARASRWDTVRESREKPTLVARNPKTKTRVKIPRGSYGVVIHDGDGVVLMDRAGNNINLHKNALAVLGAMGRGERILLKRKK